MLQDQYRRYQDEMPSTPLLLPLPSVLLFLVLIDPGIGRDIETNTETNRDQYPYLEIVLILHHPYDEHSIRWTER